MPWADCPGEPMKPAPEDITKFTCDTFPRVLRRATLGGPPRLKLLQATSSVIMPGPQKSESSWSKFSQELTVLSIGQVVCTMNFGSKHLRPKTRTARLSDLSRLGQQNTASKNEAPSPRPVKYGKSCFLEHTQIGTANFLPLRLSVYKMPVRRRCTSSYFRRFCLVIVPSDKTPAACTTPASTLNWQRSVKSRGSFFFQAQTSVLGLILYTSTMSPVFFRIRNCGMCLSHTWCGFSANLVAV